MTTWAFVNLEINKRNIKLKHALHNFDFDLKCFTRKSHPMEIARNPITYEGHSLMQVIPWINPLS